MVNMSLRQASCEGVTEEKLREIFLLFISSHHLTWLLFGIISDKYEILMKSG